jgi:hypothetical protein
LISRSEPKSKVMIDGPRTICWIQTVIGRFEFADDCDRFFLAAFLMEHAELEDWGGRGFI